MKIKTPVRRSRPGDCSAIQALHQRARRRLPQLWWWEEHLADDSFVVVEHGGIVVGALLAWPDESPVAWVRFAALDDALDVGEWLGLTLPPVQDSLRHRGTQGLAWMDYNRWAKPHLGACGFRRLTEVITLTKLDRTLPEAKPPGIYLRPVSDADIPAVVAVDRAAFTPHWWYSETTMYRRLAASSHFIVAETGTEVIGYTEGDWHRSTAHLNRIAVCPAYQGHGIGTMLLNNALRNFWRLGAKRITLNTQIDNLYSQRLYRRFGFEPTGDSVTMWELQL